MIGGYDNAALVDALVLHLDGRVFKAVGHDLLNLAALLKQCHLVISNDTGPMHIAAAVGTPVVAIFGPTAPWRTGPYSKKSSIITANLDCSPCFKKKCKHSSCMNGISVDHVFSTVAWELQKYYGTENTSI